MGAFLALVVKVFGCLHQQVNNFLHRCAYMAWSTKGFDGHFLAILHAFYRQRVLMVLQRTQVTSILKCVIILGEGFFKLIVFSNSPPFFFDMLLEISVGFGT